ncbi:hypothetical protein RI129_008686 [Pyrocoelia pectoralis]|uniref:Uncharacterized protein n=1 Tax=Pyrocoelia pectoralis TaxID=417401 RepID=A0AAN7VAB0_9COLE
MFKHINVIGESNEKFIKKFNTTCKSLRFTFNDNTCRDNPLTWLQSAFEELHTYIVKDAAPSDRVGITLRNPNFPDKPIGLSFRRVDQLSVKVIMSLLEKVMQSNASFFSSDLLVLNVDRVRVPVGYGRKNLTGLKFEDFCKSKKQGIIPSSIQKSHPASRKRHPGNSQGQPQGQISRSSTWPWKNVKVKSCPRSRVDHEQSSEPSAWPWTQGQKYVPHVGHAPPP